MVVLIDGERKAGDFLKADEGVGAPGGRGCRRGRRCSRSLTRVDHFDRGLGGALGLPPGLDGRDVEEAEFAADAVFEGDLGLFGDVEHGVVLEDFEEEGVGVGLGAGAEEVGGAEAGFPGLFEILHEGVQLGGGEVGLAGDGAVFEEVADGEGVAGVDADAHVVVGLDAFEFGLGGVDEVFHGGVHHGVHDGLEGLAFAGGDGFVGVGGEAVALFDEDELAGGGGDAGEHGGDLGGVRCGDAGGFAGGGEGGLLNDEGHAVGHFLKAALGLGAFFALGIELTLEGGDLGAGLVEGDFEAGGVGCGGGALADFGVGELLAEVIGAPGDGGDEEEDLEDGEDDEGEPAGGRGGGGRGGLGLDGACAGDEDTGLGGDGLGSRGGVCEEGFARGGGGGGFGHLRMH